MKLIKPEGQVKLQKQLRVFYYRQEPFQIVYHTWVDNENGDEFTTLQLDAINLEQVYYQYRIKYGISFADWIKMMS
ncbi:hypothetical protein [Flavihumibacter sp. UBA7668]|uniref:hypothetical protein n=1 Tax=Flavihumibacter sp. UBA7668 TaxID=1946542 RepID=UPI0025BE54D3|nr:hypothetical protein [Flavihumibacter sp. UBA7668]